nr:MAG TPA: hypothetical protein [Caudoviricetes sp.]
MKKAVDTVFFAVLRRTVKVLRRTHFRLLVTCLLLVSYRNDFVYFDTI